MTIEPHFHIFSHVIKAAQCIVSALTSPHAHCRTRTESHGLDSGLVAEG